MQIILHIWKKTSWNIYFHVFYGVNVLTMKNVILVQENDKQ